MSHAYSEVRRHQRIRVPDQHRIRAVADADGPGLEGTVTVIGLGGMFLRTNRAISNGARIHMRLLDPEIPIESDCIVRSVSDNGLGMEFAELTPENEARLHELIQHLRG